MKTLLFILCLGSSISIQANTMNRFEGEEKEELISLNSELLKFRKYSNNVIKKG